MKAISPRPSITSRPSKLDTSSNLVIFSITTRTWPFQPRTYRHSAASKLRSSSSSFAIRRIFLCASLAVDPPKRGLSSATMFDTVVWRIRSGSRNSTMGYYPLFLSSSLSYVVMLFSPAFLLPRFLIILLANLLYFLYRYTRQFHDRRSEM